MNSRIVEEADGNCSIKCHIQPSASKTAVVGIYNGALKVSLAAPPVDGKANKALRTFIAKQLKLQKSKVRMIKGEKSRSKVILCEDITRNEVEALIPVLK
jgi:uncharacterized protein (TIGR00251 family)